MSGRRASRVEKDPGWSSAKPFHLQCLCPQRPDWLAEDSLNEAVEGEELDGPTFVNARKRRTGIGTRHDQLGLGVSAGKDQQVSGIEVASRPLAFDGQRVPPPRKAEEVHFVALFVAPISQIGRLQMRREFVEDVVLPKPAQIVTAQAGPAAVSAYKAGVEPIDLRRRNDLVASVHLV